MHKPRGAHAGGRRHHRLTLGAPASSTASGVGVAAVLTATTEEIAVSEATKDTQTAAWRLALEHASEACPNVGPEYWVSDGSEPGESWCRDCIKAAVKADIDAGYTDARRDGGWGGSDCDSMPACSGCGSLLNGSPSKYCIESELEHFEHFGFDGGWASIGHLNWSGRLEDMIARLEGGYCYDDKDRALATRWRAVLVAAWADHCDPAARADVPT